MKESKAPVSHKVIHLTASEIVDAMKTRYLAHVGWDGKKVDGKKRLINRPLVMLGHKGVGKSELPAQAAKVIAEAIGKPVMTRSCNLQFLECPDLAGLPYIDVESDGTKTTRHGRPWLLPKDGFGLWFLDEPNRAGRDIRSALLTLIQARQVNDYPIGPNWMVVMAMNPSEADGVTYEVGEWDAALQDRVSPLWFKGSVTELTNYLRGVYGNHPVVRWIESGGPNEETNSVVDFKGKGRHSPRGLEFLIRAIEAEGGVDSPGSFRAAATEIGEELATVFKSFLRSIQTVKAEEILDEYGPAVQQKLHDFEEQGRNDVINTIGDAVVTELAKRCEAGKLKPGSKEWETVLTRVCRYLDDAPAELKTGFFLVGGDRFSTLVTEKSVFLEMCKFIKDNAPALHQHLVAVKAARKVNAPPPPSGK